MGFPINGTSPFTVLELLGLNCSIQGYCWPKMMMDPKNGPFACPLSFEPWVHFTFKYIKISQFDGPSEILMDPLENLTGQRAFYMPVRAKLMIYLNSLCIYMDPVKNNVHFGLHL